MNINICVEQSTFATISFRIIHIQEEKDKTPLLSTICSLFCSPSQRPSSVCKLFGVSSEEKKKEKEQKQIVHLTC